MRLYALYMHTTNKSGLAAWCKTSGYPYVSDIANVRFFNKLSNAEEEAKRLNRTCASLGQFSVSAVDIHVSEAIAYEDLKVDPEWEEYQRLKRKFG